MFSKDILATPPQKKSTAEKYKNNQQWFKDTADSYEYQALYYEQERHRKMQVLYNLDNGEVDQNEMERVMNPLGLNNATFPSSIKNYAIAVPKIDLLIGEEIRRTFDWTVRSKNPSDEASEADTMLDMFIEMAISNIEQGNKSEEQIQKEIEQYARFIKYSFKDVNEITATKILNYLWRNQNIKYEFNKAYRHGLVGSRIIYRIDIEGEEPVLKACDPREVYVIKPGNSEYIQDAEAIVEITYEPLGRIVDTYYDYLEPGQIDELEAGQWRTNGRGSEGSLNYKNKLPPIYSNLDFGDGPGFIDINEFNSYENFKLGLPYDYQGNIRVVRTRWVGRKQIGILFYMDENGDEQERIVSEYYKPNKDEGETVKWIWINETYETTKLADSTYIKMEPREVQMRKMDNKSKCFLGYIGYDFGISLMERMESFQYLYNVYMNKLEQIYAKYKGPIYELDISKVPDDWDMDMWMYYADMMGWAVIDPMNEGKKGAAMGKLSGAFNTTGKVLDPRIGDYIQQTILMLQYLEKELGVIAGVTEQRQGQVDNRETAQGVERAVTQSALITEKWFFAHDETKKKALSALLDTAKQLWSKTESKRLSFIMDDMSREFLEFNGADFASTEQDIFISNSSEDMRVRQMIEGQSQALIQNGMGSTVIDIMQKRSIAEKSIILREAEERLQEMEQKKMEQQSQIVQQQLEAQAAEKDRELKFKYDELNSKERIEMAKIDNEARKTYSEIEKTEEELRNEEQQFNEEMSFKDEQLDETIRHNKESEKISKIKSKSTNNG